MIIMEGGRKRRPHDYYPSPSGAVLAGLSLLRGTPRTILDPGAGCGVFGRVARLLWPEARVTGVELREVGAPAEYARWHAGEDFLTWDSSGVLYEAVVGNPPYFCAEGVVRRSLDLLAPGGELLFLLRLAFLEGQARGRTLWREHPPAEVAVLSRRPSFTADGKTDSTAYAFFRWVKGGRGPTTLSWLAP